MASFTDVFGGSTIQSSQVAYRAVSLTASITTFWPQFATANNYLARIMDVTPIAAGFTISMPDATLATVGQDVFFNNRGLYSFTVLDFSGNVISVIVPGAVRYIYLNDVTLPAGSWTSILFGAASSVLDASQLVGMGLTTINNTLANAAPTVVVTSNTIVTSTGRSVVYIWTGGTGTLTLPGVATVGSNFFFEVRNQGTGVLTITPVNGELFDGSANAQMQLNESFTAHAGPAAWYSVGRGRNTQFNFTQLVKTVTGGTNTLTLTEAANVVQTYTGTLTTNEIIVLPAVVQIYYVTNATTGAFTFTFKNPTTGTTVTIPNGQSAVLFSDGVNVTNSATTIAGVSALLLQAGTMASPSLAIGTASTGLYAPSTGQIGVSAAGVQVAQFDVSGIKAVGTSAIILQAISAGGQASIEADRLAGQIGRIGWRTAGVDRFAVDADASSESGSNAGSNLALNAFSDAGALLGPVWSIARATQVASYTNIPNAAGAQVANISAAQTLTNKSINGSTNTLTNIPAGNIIGVVALANGGTGNTTGTATINANLTGGVTSVGNAATVVTNANLTGGVTSVGNAATVVTNANLTGPVTSAGNATAFTNGMTVPAFTLAGAVAGGGNQINNVVIGASTPLAGSFTTLGTTGAINFGAGAVVTDISGNLGLGVTPSAWLSGYKVLQLPSISLFSGGGNGGFFLANSYINTSGAFTYQSTGPAASYNNQGGTHQFGIAPSGIAGAAITFTQAMTLDAGGNLGIGETAPSTYGKLTVTGSSDGAGVSAWVRNTSDASADNVKYAGIQFSVGSDNGSTAIRSYRTNSGTDYSSALAFLTKGNGASATSPTERMRLDANGNLGLGVTPNVWTNTKAVDIANYGAISTDTVNDANISVSWNSYSTAFNAWKYKNTGSAASRYAQQAGIHTWHNAPSGTAGNPITFTQAMTLDASGNLLVGTTTAIQKLTVTGGISATGTISSGGYTVATLPAGVRGMIAYVTDALTPGFLTIVVGGGSVVSPVFYNGSNWVAG